MKIFIENEAGSRKKNIFDEKTLDYKKTVVVSREYPYPYGFVLDTTSGDGDNLDCFVLTKTPLKSGDIVEGNVVGMFEDVEDGEEDPKILVCLEGETVTIDEPMKALFKEFTEHVFDHLPNKQKTMGEFFGAESAEALIQHCKDK